MTQSDEKALAIVREVIESHGSFKTAGGKLRALPASIPAAKRLIDARDARQVPDWLAAYLLGANGAQAGYATTLDILDGAKDRNTSNHAGPALAKIDPVRALDDLANLDSLKRNKFRFPGSIFGLGEIGTEEAVRAILTTAPVRYGTTTAATLAQLPAFTGEMLSELAESANASDAKLAVDVLHEFLVREPVRGQELEQHRPRLEDSLAAVLGRNDLWIGRAQRETAIRWLKPRLSRPDVSANRE